MPGIFGIVDSSLGWRALGPASGGSREADGYGHASRALPLGTSRLVPIPRCVRGPGCTRCSQRSRQSRCRRVSVRRCRRRESTRFAAGKPLREETLRSLAGRCAAFVADHQAGRCYLVNDRYGKERLFLHVDGTRTYFASEAKAILAVAARTRGFDQAGLAELFACGCTLGSRSLFSGIEVLEPGTEVAFDRSGVRRRRVFSPQDLESLEPVSGPEFLDGFVASLRAAVRLAVETRPRSAMSLTGGLDSRMIMASLDAPPAVFLATRSAACIGRRATWPSPGRWLTVAAPHQVVELGMGSWRGSRTTSNMRCTLPTDTLGSPALRNST